MNKTFLLTFDLEEFDFPTEHNIKISKERQYETSYEGCKKIIQLLDENNAKSTFFVTTAFASKYKNLIKDISKKHEIAFHGYEHSDDYANMSKEKALERIRSGKKKLENICGKVIGFRAPKFKKPSFELLEKLGFEYDSSVHPTYVPGRYMNLFSSRRIHKVNGITEVPISVTPVLRLPFSWLWFRNLGLGYAKFCTLLSAQDYVNLYFHPWEFSNIKDYKIPGLVKRRTGPKILEMLDSYIKWCRSENFRFRTIRDYLKL